MIISTGSARARRRRRRKKAPLIGLIGDAHHFYARARRPLYQFNSYRIRLCCYFSGGDGDEGSLMKLSVGRRAETGRVLCCVCVCKIEIEVGE